MAAESNICLTGEMRTKWSFFSWMLAAGLRWGGWTIFSSCDLSAYILWLGSENSSLGCRISWSSWYSTKTCAEAAASFVDSVASCCWVKICNGTLWTFGDIGMRESGWIDSSWVENHSLGICWMAVGDFDFEYCTVNLLAIIEVMDSLVVESFGLLARMF